MIVSEHIEGYIDSLIPDLPDDLRVLEEWALLHGVPIIRRSMQQYLRMLLAERKPERILEIGTAIGFSALYLERFSRSDTEITTIEKVEMRLKEARKNLRGHDRIRLIEGDALSVLDNMALNHTERYDFIFLDAAKGQYPEFLKPITKILDKGGMLVTDNVLLEGTIAESKFSIERRDRTIHKRMREYLYELTHSDEYETAILPVGDGVAVSVKL
jgi:predicted O-methyltransferase YrrM